MDREKASGPPSGAFRHVVAESRRVMNRKGHQDRRRGLQRPLEGWLIRPSARAAVCESLRSASVTSRSGFQLGERGEIGDGVVGPPQLLEGQTPLTRRRLSTFCPDRGRVRNPQGRHRIALRPKSLHLIHPRYELWVWQLFHFVVTNVNLVTPIKSQHGGRRM